MTFLHKPSSADQTRPQTRDFFQKSDLFINKKIAENPPGSENDKFSQPNFKTCKSQNFFVVLFRVSVSVFGLKAQVRVWTLSPYFLHF
jgi:hypothetical protein